MSGNPVQVFMIEETADPSGKTWGKRGHSHQRKRGTNVATDA